MDAQTIIKKTFAKRFINKIFESAIILKSLFGFFEVLAGTALAISGQAIMNKFIIILAQQEVADDKNDFVINYLTKIANNLSVGTHTFAIAYLIFHGIINIFLAVALLKNKLWAYPWAAAGFSIFIVYQAYKYLYTHSPLLLVLTIFDIFVVTIIMLEYRNKRKAR